jgi:hypothetical protein
MSIPHDDRPDPQFVERLEWQLRSEVRRQDRFAPPARSRRALRSASTVLLSLLVGFATATAAQQIGDRRNAGYLRLQAEGAVELAEIRVRFVQEMLEAAEARADTDAHDPRYMRWELRQAQWDLERARLQVEEIDATHESPRDDLVAPLVAGRDFVRERLELERAMLEARAEMVRGEATPRGAVDSRAGMEHEVARVEAQIARIDADLDLRARFLGGAASGEQILRTQRAEQAQARLSLAESRIEEGAARLAGVRQRQARGQADTVDVRAAEFELAAARLDARLARLDVQVGRGQ